MARLGTVIFAMVIVALFRVGAANSDDLVPRDPHPIHPLIPVEGEEYNLIVKFTDGIRARENGGDIVFLGEGDSSGFPAIVLQQGLRFEQLFDVPNAKLAALEERAASNSGYMQPDFAGYFIVHFESDQASGDTLASVGEALQRLQCVEYAGLQVVEVSQPTCTFTGCTAPMWG